MELRWQTESFTASDGIRLAYVVDDFTDPWAKAPALLLVHAAMGSSRRFYAWVPHLAREFRVVRMDLRGHGESGIPSAQQLTLERLVLDAVELLDHLGIERVHLAGSSAGAVIAQQVAIANPARIATLALFASTPGLKHGKQDYGGWVRRIAAQGVAAFLRETAADRFDLSAVEAGFVDWFIGEAARSDPDLLARFVPLMASVDLSQRLTNIRCPTLAVAPGADPIHTVDEYRVLKQRIPDCEFVVYEGMAHNITDAVPDRCAEEIKRFLLSHTRPQQP